MIEVWKNLLKDLHGINSYIKPTNELERRGYYSQESFKKKGKAITLKMTAVEEAIKDDKLNKLKDALKPLFGREGKLVDTTKLPSGEICQNMAVLVTSEIIRVFKEAEIELEKIKNKNNGNLPAEKVETEEQYYLGSFFTTDQVDEILDENPWYKPRSSPKRVPEPDYETLLPDNLVTDNDIIQHFKYDFSLSPPIVLSRAASKEKMLKIIIDYQNEVYFRSHSVLFQIYYHLLLLLDPWYHQFYCSLRLVIYLFQVFLLLDILEPVHGDLIHLKYQLHLF
jgi:hypothetical protein